MEDRQGSGRNGLMRPSTLVAVLAACALVVSAPLIAQSSSWGAHVEMVGRAEGGWQELSLDQGHKERTGKLADLIDSPLMLAKQKIDQYVDMDLGPDGQAKKKVQEFAPILDRRDLVATVENAYKRLADMQLKLREEKNFLKHGPKVKVNVDVHPRGPRGPTGPKGGIGPTGLKGPRGGQGPPGRKGLEGPMGVMGPQGRQGLRGPTGGIGKPGGVGDKGDVGATGRRGDVGPAGSRGLPGAAGSPGANGRQGIPGPPGKDGSPGRIGPAGPPGPQGPPGLTGKQGPKGPTGVGGTNGEDGLIGPRGPQGPKGQDGKAFPQPMQELTQGAWPDGDCWTSDQTCKDLGIAYTMCGKCEKLCENCPPEAGFKLTNDIKGLRYDGFGFDDNNIERGNYQAQNICILARYGNRGTITKFPTDESYGVTSATAPPERHWFGNCGKGSQSDSKCCSNARLLSSGFDWGGFSVGNSCSGDVDTDSVISEIFCVFDTDAYARGLMPPKPLSILKEGTTLPSQGDPFKTDLQSPDGKCLLKWDVTDVNSRFTIQSQSQDVAVGDQCSAMRRLPCKATSHCQYHTACGCIPRKCICGETDCIKRNGMSAAAAATSVKQEYKSVNRAPPGRGPWFMQFVEKSLVIKDSDNRIIWKEGAGTNYAELVSDEKGCNLKLMDGTKNPAVCNWDSRGTCKPPAPPPGAPAPAAATEGLVACKNMRRGECKANQACRYHTACGCIPMKCNCGDTSCYKLYSPAGTYA